MPVSRAPARIYTITNTFNSAQQVTQVTSSVNNATKPGTLATLTYYPFGALNTLVNGCAGTGCTNVRESYFYNKRLQPAVVELGTAANHALDSCRVYNYYAGVANANSCSENPANWPTGTNNNGNVVGYYFNDAVTSGLSHKATYTYDGVNRLASAAATGNSTYSQSYSYTRDGSTGQFGNLGCTPAGPGCMNFTYSSSTNRITTSGYAYDAAGNLTGDSTNTYQWDAEGRLTKALNGGGTAIATHTYNALGQRVQDIANGVTKNEIYGPGGELNYITLGGGPNDRALIPLGGRLVTEYSSAMAFFPHPDALGSLTTASDYTGNNFNERLFYPYGEFWTGAGLPGFGMQQTFAEIPDYDSETDQYVTWARRHNPVGRWMSPDPLSGDVSNPQSLNRYAYVLNNATSLTDPSGLGPCDGKTGAALYDCATGVMRLAMPGYQSIYGSMGGPYDPFNWIWSDVKVTSLSSLHWVSEYWVSQPVTEVEGDSNVDYWMSEQQVPGHWETDPIDKLTLTLTMSGTRSSNSSSIPDVPLSPSALKILSKVYRNTATLENPCTPVIFYGASAGIAAGSAAFANATGVVATLETWGVPATTGLSWLSRSDPGRVAVFVGNKLNKVGNVVQSACGSVNW